MIEFSMGSVFGLLWFAVWYVARNIAISNREKYNKRIKEIEIAEIRIKAFQTNADKLISSDILPLKAKKMIMFFVFLLNDEQEAKQFINCLINEMDSKKQSINDNVLYKELLSKTKEYPEILEDFNVVINDGLIALMFKWPNQSDVYFKILSHPSTKTSNEVSFIENYSAKKYAWETNSLVAC